MATVQAADLPVILAALAKEGAVPGAEEQGKPRKTAELVVIELVLIP